MMYRKKDKRMNHTVGSLIWKGLSIILTLPPFVVLVFAGCAAVGPNYNQAVPKAPEKWHAKLQSGLSAGQLNSETLAHWWTTLNDSELSSLVERAATSNLTLKDAQARLHEARALRGISRAGLFPDMRSLPGEP